MKQQSIVIALAAMAIGTLQGLTGCAQINDTGMSLLSSTVPAVAIVDAQLLQGEIKLFPDHTGTVTLRAPGLGAASLTSCVGRLRYTATTTGSIDLRCNGGVMADVKTTLLGDTRGYGYGSTASGMASLAFGMTSAESRAHLIVPPNRQLVSQPESSDLELK